MIKQIIALSFLLSISAQANEQGVNIFGEPDTLRWVNGQCIDLSVDAEKENPARAPEECTFPNYFEAELEVTGENVYKVYLQDLGYCSSSMCGQKAVAAPKVSVLFRTVSFSNQWGLPAQIHLDASENLHLYGYTNQWYSPSQPQLTNFWKVNNSDVFEAAVFTFKGQLRYTVTNITKEEVEIEVSYKGKTMGNAILKVADQNEFNMPYYGYGQFGNTYQPGYPSGSPAQ